MKEADPIAVARYGHASGMEGQRGWKWIKQYSKIHCTFITLCKYFMVKERQTPSNLAWKSLIF